MKQMGKPVLQEREAEEARTSKVSDWESPIGGSLSLKAVGSINN